MGTAPKWDPHAPVRAWVCGIAFILAVKAIKEMTGMDGIVVMTLLGAVWLPAAFAHFFWSWSYGRCTRGRTLLDSGGYPQAAEATVAIIILVVSSIVFGIFGTTWVWFRFELAVASMIAIVQCAIGVTGRLQFRESGIWCYYWLLPWERIKSYTWSHDRTLILKLWGVLEIWRQLHLQIPQDQMDTVVQFLQDHCAGANQV